MSSLSNFRNHQPPPLINIPGSRLLQKYRHVSHNLNNKSEEIYSIDKEIHILKAQYSKSQRAQSQFQSRKNSRYEEKQSSLSRDRKHTNQTHSEEQKHPRIQKLSPKVYKEDKKVMGEQNFQRATITSSIHTQHRYQMRQISELQSELKELEKKHQYVQKDFKVIQKEKKELQQCNEELVRQVRSMESQLMTILTKINSMYSHEDSQLLVIKLKEDIKELQNTNQSFKNIVSERDLQIVELEKEIRDYRKKSQGASTQKPPLPSNYGDQLAYDYGIVRSPRVNTTSVNKECQTLPNELPSSNNEILDKYQKLLIENQNLLQELGSRTMNSQRQDQNFSEVLKNIMNLRNLIVKKYLGNQKLKEEVCQDQDVKYFNSLLIEIYQIVDENIKATTVELEDEEQQQVWNQVEGLKDLYNNSIDIEQFSMQQLQQVSRGQDLFKELIVLFQQQLKKQEMSFVKVAQLKNKNRMQQQNLEKVKSALSDDFVSQQLVQINQEQLNQLIKLKKVMVQTNKENDLGESKNQPFKKVTLSNQKIKNILTSPVKVNDQNTVSSPINKDKMTKSPQNFTDKKLSYITLKLKESERQLEQKSCDLQEREFQVKNFETELERKNSQITNLQQILEEMNTKINSQLKYIEKLEYGHKNTEQKYLIETQVNLRKHEDLQKSLNFKEKELEEIKSLSFSQTYKSRDQEQLEQNIQLLRSQYEREKRLVEEKVRQITELQSSSVQESSLLKENADLKYMNIELNSVIKEERLLYEESRKKMSMAVQQLKDKIINIENGCAKELVLKLKALRDEVFIKTENKMSMSRVSQNDTVDNMIREVQIKVNQIVKQRESLTNAVNVLQSEKQNLYNQLQESQRNPFRRNLMQSQPNMIVAGTISRANPMELSLPQCQPSYSPHKIGQKSINNNTMVRQTMNHLQVQDESNLYEYLQAEIMALRGKKTELSQKKEQLEQNLNEQEKQLEKLDIFAKKENIEQFGTLIQIIKEVLAQQDQEHLLEEIVSKPFKQKKDKKEHAVDGSLVFTEDSFQIFRENSIKMMNDLESLLPLISKSLQLQGIRIEKLNDNIKVVEQQKAELARQKVSDIEKLSHSNDQNKQIIKQLEQSYKQELGYLKAEKDQISQKSRDFAKSLQQLKSENEKKSTQIKNLEREVTALQEELRENSEKHLNLEEKIKKEQKEFHQRDFECRLQKQKDEAYYKGRKEGADEMVLENKKLMEIIESLRGESSSKSKKVSQLQFQVDDLQRAKKKTTEEINELNTKLNKERESQRALQDRLETLLQETELLQQILSQNLETVNEWNLDPEDYTQDGQTRDMRVQQISPRLYQDIEGQNPDARLKNIHSIIPQPDLQLHQESSTTKHLPPKGEQPQHLLLVNHKFSTPSNDQGKNNRIVSQRLKSRIEQQVEKKNFELVKKKVKSNNFFIEKQQPYIQTTRQINLCDSPYTKDKKNLTVSQIDRKESVPKQMAEFAKNYYASKKPNNQKSQCKLQTTKSQNTTPTRPKEASYLKIGKVQINFDRPPASSYAVQAKFAQNQTQRTSQPAIQSDSDWRDIRKFLEVWNLSLKQAKAYSQQEMIEFIRQVEQRIIEIDQVTNYERMKANDFRDENNKLIEEINQEKDNVRTLQRDYTLTQKDIEKQEAFIQKLQECQQQLKQSQYQNLICLDFYKDIEAFIIENKFEEENDEFQKQIIKLELLLQEHGLHLMDFDTDRTQVLIDSIADLIFDRQIEMENLEKELMDKSVDDELYGKNGIKFKINKVKKSKNLAFNNINFDKANSRTHSQQRSESTKGGQPFNRHVLCCSGNVVAFKAEINHKNQIIQKQREQLEHRIKKITQLKVQLQKAKNNELLIQEKLKFKESVVKLENEFNDQVIQNTKQQLENKNLKEENQKLLQEMVAFKEMNKKLEYETGEIKKLLSTNEGFKKLDDTVMDLTNLLISKGQKHLNSSQKFLLQAIFGNSAILTKMKQRIMDSENYGRKISSLLTRSLTVILDFQELIEEQWSLLRQLYEALMQQKSGDKFQMTPELFEILKFLKKNANDPYMDEYERNFAGKLVSIKDIRNEISREETLNQMSRQMLEENDSTSLLSRIANRRLSDQRNKSCLNLCKTPEHDPLQFSDSKYQDDMSSKVQTQKINFHYDQPLKSEHAGRGSCNQVKLESILGSIIFPEAPDDFKTTLLNKSKEENKRKSPLKDSNTPNRFQRKVTPKKHDSESSVIQRVYQVMNDQNELQDMKIVFGEEEQLLNPPLLDIPNLTEKSKSHSRSHGGKKTSYRVQYRILKEENENLRQRISEMELKIKDVPQQETLDSLNKNKKSAVSLPGYIEQLQKELEFDDSEKNMKAQILETSIRTTKENEIDELERSDLYQMIQLQAHAFEQNKEEQEDDDQ